jgi:hypothetical protein
MMCFHIRWSSSQLDWECHHTREKAEFSAQQLARQDETFSVEKYQDVPGGLPCPFSHPLEIGALQPTPRSSKRVS